LVSDSSAEQFLLSFRRFCAAYGKPSTVISDNATNFKGTERLFQQLLKSDDVQDYSAKNRIKWIFITALAPWMGGFYERLVGTVKRALQRTLGKQLLTYSQLQTTVAEIACVVNSRPLVRCNAVDDSSTEALSPAHFLARRARPGLPVISAVEDEEYLPPRRKNVAQALLLSWRQGQRLLNVFWDIWRNEYLAALRERNDSKAQRHTATCGPKIGATVLIKDSLPRCRWKMGRIKELRQSQDGLCRSAVVSLPQNKQVIRAIRHLYPLEVTDEGDDAEGVVNGQTDKVNEPDASVFPNEEANSHHTQLSDDEAEYSTNKSSRPRRQAAIIARQAIRMHTDQPDCEDE
jgi:hypothetical protein